MDKALTTSRVAYLCYSGLLTVLCCQMVMAQPDYRRSSRVKQQIEYIHIYGDRLTLKDIRETIMDQTTYNVYIAPGVHPSGFTVSLHYDRVAITKVLDSATRSHGLTYKISSGNISINQDTTIGQIKVYVRDHEERSIPKATIQVNGKVVGETNEDGIYMLSLYKGDDTVMATCADKTPGKQAISGLNDLVLHLASRPPMKPVVVKIDTDPQKEAPPGRFFGEKDPFRFTAAGIDASLLLNLAQNVQVTPRSGIPGSGIDIRIRGWNGLEGDNPPLFIIDGTPFVYQRMGAIAVGNSGGVGFNPLSFLSGAIIEKIVVLKDADSLARYGARGANGAIIITTSRRPEKKFLIVNAATGVSMPARDIHLLNSNQYIDMRKEALKNDGLVPDIQNAPDLLKLDPTRQTDWGKTILRPGKYAEGTVSAGIGGQKLFLNTMLNYGQ